MTSKLDLSIIIPTLNTEKTIRLTLESIKPLKELGAKIILVDSYSTDKTVELAKEYCEEILQHPKGNMYAAINEGMKKANTEWVSYINADDVVYSDIIINTFNDISTEVDFFYGDIDFIDWHGRFLHSFIFPEPSDIIPLATDAICGWSPIGTFFKKIVWEKLDGFDVNYKYSSDFDFMLRSYLTNFIFKKIRHPVGAFRLHPNQLSQHHGSPGLQENYEIIKNLKICSPLKKRFKAKWMFKLRNFLEFAIRIFRRRRLSSNSSSLSCIAPPEYDKKESVDRQGGNE